MENYEEFKKEFFNLSHINLSAYKEKQMKRRIETLIARKGMDSFEKFYERLTKDEKDLEYFVDYITINVTEFFRTPEHWNFLEEKIISGLKEKQEKNGGTLKIWSSGCSTGEEPYSLSMMLLENLKNKDFHITATDIDEKVLEKAKRGIYSGDEMENFPESFLSLKEKYFEESVPLNKEKNPFRIKDEVKNLVEFKKLDMTQENFPEGCDLILARNVLIYFTEETKQEIFKKFAESLKKGGVIFLGHTEQIIFYKNYGLEKLARNFYRKK